MFQNSKSLFLAIVAFLLGFPVITLLLYAKDPLIFGQFGENDFLQYWSANQLAKRGADLFDPRLVFAVEKARGWTEARPLMMWNPPWLLIILSPILYFDFEIAARLFLGLNLGMIFGAVLLLLDCLSKNYSKLNIAFLLIFSLFFFPLFLSLKLGQISVLVMFFTSLLIWALSKKKYFLLGISLSLISVKIQLLYLLCLFLPFAIEKENWKKVFIGSFVGITFLLLSLHFYSPDTMLHWISRSKHEVDPLLISVFSWKTTTLVTLVRDLIFRTTGSFTIWPMYAVPFITAAIFFLYFLKKGVANKFAYLAFLLPISCFTSPFGWIYDASLCLITNVYLFSVFQKDKKQDLFICLVSFLLQGVLFFHYQKSEPEFFAYWYFYPVYIALVCFTFLNRVKKNES